MRRTSVKWRVVFERERDGGDVESRQAYWAGNVQAREDGVRMVGRPDPNIPI
jgi:hypothetical protein